MATLDELEKRLIKIEDKKKDWWDKLHTIGALLVPLAVGLAGYFASAAISKSQVDAAGVVADQARESANNIADEAREVEESKLINLLLDPLTGENELQRRIAILAVAHTEPVTAKDILEVLEELDKKPETTKKMITELKSQLHGSECNQASDCVSNYCYPGPQAGTKFCLRQDLNCAFPGSSGVRYGEVRVLGNKSYECHNPGGGQLANWK